MNLLSINQVSKRYDLKIVLKDITFGIDSGERMGIIGANGSGKTTLFNLIAGVYPPDTGTVSIRRGITVGLLPQEPHLDPALTIQQTLAASLVEVQQTVTQYQQMTERLAQCQDEQELQALHSDYEVLEHRMEQVGGWHYQHRIDTILGHLKLAQHNGLVGQLSGGERKRVALACVLIQNPELLILDEPTNHLDALTITWLEDYLDNYKGALLLITHDRYFLDNVVDRMLELARGQATSYQGGYSDYLSARAERQASEARAHASLLNLLRREEEWLRRGVRARGTKSKYRIQSVLDLREQARVEAELVLEMQLSTTKRLGSSILVTEHLTKRYQDQPLVEDLNFIMVKGDRVGVVGPNGCGKTTLLKTLIGEEVATSGRVILGKNTVISYFAQNRLDMDMELTVWQYISDNAEMVKVKGEFRTVRSYINDFKFTADRLENRLKTLSGGEKNRLVLAKMLLTDANLLVLDEPTNDLDIETLQWVEQALIDFPGCVLFVSHDRFFMDKVATALLVFEGNGRIAIHAGNYSLYKQLTSDKALEKAESTKATLAPSASETPKTNRKGLSYKEQQELTNIEKSLAALESEIKTLEAQLSDPVSHGLGSNYTELTKLVARLAEAKAASDGLSERWLELEEKRS